MNIAGIMLARPENYTGYMPQSVSKTTFDPRKIEGWEPLQRIPRKITAYFDREKITAVYKSNHRRNPLDNYYIIITIDGTLFHVDY